MAVRRAIELGNFGFFLEMGTGKTRCAIETVMHYVQAVPPAFFPRTMIFCPPVTIRNWQSEIRRYSPIPDHKILLLTGPKKARIEAFTEMLALQKGFIVITNYESLLMDELYFEGFEKWRPEILIIDESQRVKDLKAKRTKRMISLAAKAQHKFLLSGTPILNSALDLFAQYKIMLGGWPTGNPIPRLALMKNFYDFRYRYFADANAYMPSHMKWPSWVFKKKMDAEIQQVINATSMRITKKEALELPPLVKKRQYVEMSKDQAKLYKSMFDDFIAYIGSHACVAQTALTKIIRLQQIISGFVKMEDGSIRHIHELPRANALYDLLASLIPAHKVIVWAVFRENFKLIKNTCGLLNVEAVEVHGDITAAQKELAIEKFNHDPHTKVYIGHPGAGGIGINLTIADYMIYYSRDFSLEHDMQSEARNHRGGSEIHDKITRIDLVTPDSIDETILNRLLAKQQMGEALIARLREDINLKEAS